jgi:hypothetical protein
MTASNIHESGEGETANETIIVAKIATFAG